MLEKESEKQQGIGCLTLGGILYLIFLSIETFFIVTHPPIDFLSLAIYTAIFIFYLFFCSPWGRPLLHKVPFLANGPLIIVVCFSFYILLKLYSFNSPQVFFGLFVALLCILYLSPWAKSILRWSPFVLLFLIILGSILTISPLVSQTPIDYRKLFTVLVAFLGMLAFLFLFPRFFRGRLMRQDKTKDIHFRIGQTAFPTEGTEPAAKTVVDFHFLGITLRILRAGKFWKVTLSTD